LDFRTFEEAKQDLILVPKIPQIEKHDLIWLPKIP